MESRDILKRINSHKLKRVLEHWWEIRGNRLMPAWQDIRPAKFKEALPIVWSYRYDPVEDEFLGGLAGEEIRRLLGGPIKNARFRNVHKADPQFSPRIKRVLSGPALFFGRGLLFKQRRRLCYGERIILPFSGEDGQAAGIFGATDFKFAFQYQSGPETCGEVEYWFDLTLVTGSLPTGPSESVRHLTSEIAEVS
jgi:hypothetical protein